MSLPLRISMSSLPEPLITTWASCVLFCFVLSIQRFQIATLSRTLSTCLSAEEVRKWMSLEVEYGRELKSQRRDSKQSAGSLVTWTSYLSQRNHLRKANLSIAAAGVGRLFSTFARS